MQREETALMNESKIATRAALKEVLGENIRFHRKLMDMTLAELAEVLNITPGYLGLVERGKRTLYIEKLKYISEVLGVSINSLLSKGSLDGKERLNNRRERTIKKIISYSSKLNDKELERLSKIIKLIIVDDTK